MVVSLMTKGTSAGVQDLIDVLPEAVAWAEGRNSPIVVPDPCTEHGRRLLRTLGAWVAEFRIPPGHVVNGLGKQQNRLSGRCPDFARCYLEVWCSNLCLRLEATEIAELLRAEALLAGGRKVT